MISRGLVDTPRRSPGTTARPVGGNRLRYQHLTFALKFPGVSVACWERFYGPGFVPPIVPSGHDRTLYLVVNNFGNLGTAFPKTDVDKADLETVIGDLMSGQYSDPVCVVAFNTAEQWAEDASEDVAREIMRRLDLVGHEPPSSIAAFVELHLGPDRQLSLRLN
jgi:hypothetical protein